MIENEKFKLLTEAYFNMEYCMERIKGNKEKLLAFVEATRAMRHLLDQQKFSVDGSDQNEEGSV